MTGSLVNSALYNKTWKTTGADNWVAHEVTSSSVWVCQTSALTLIFTDWLSKQLPIFLPVIRWLIASHADCFSCYNVWDLSVVMYCKRSMKGEFEQFNISPPQSRRRWWKKKIGCERILQRVFTSPCGIHCPRWLKVTIKFSFKAPWFIPNLKTLSFTENRSCE